MNYLKVLFVLLSLSLVSNVFAANQKEEELQYIDSNISELSSKENLSKEDSTRLVEFMQRKIYLEKELLEDKHKKELSKKSKSKPKVWRKPKPKVTAKKAPKAKKIVHEALYVMRKPASEEHAKKKWYEKTKIKTDFRYRYENIVQEDKRPRVRERFRIRVALTQAVQEDLEVKLRLATGSDDPVSTNQSLDGGFTSKNIMLDQAYFKYTPKDYVTINGGKMKNPMVNPGKSQLVWDGDLTPEGLHTKLSHKSNDWEYFLNLGRFWAEERKSSSVSDDRAEDEDTIINAYQLGTKGKIGSTKVLLGGSVYNYTNMKGNKALADSTDGFGNTTTTSGSDELYDNDYNLVESFLTVDFKVASVPVMLLYNAVQNTQVDEDNKGHVYGIKLGKAKKPGQFEVKFYQAEVEKDAVVGAYTNSDFGGGGTDKNGHVIGLKYKLTPKSSLGVTYFENQTAIEDGKDYKRTQVDYVIKF